ncbi:hypothetical protein [Moraxella bovis]|uniref:hypothetical protein n=1 Tax=Moraxella bovis TaxID=476 RepID=UPI002226D673|nr:hypothetical protein [Moraxella bovis]UZA19179.1 hypothetical protein LP088_12925 [Moraxella bovis]
MLFVSDNFELSKDKIAVITKFYPQTKITNTGNTTANILKSKDGSNWTLLTSLASEQSSDVTLEEEFIYLTFKEDTVVYFQHQTPNHYHTEQENASASSVNKLSGQVVELSDTKADKTFVDTEIGKLGQAILENTQNDEQALQEVSSKITALIQADKGLVSATSGQMFSDEQKQIARNNIGAVNTSDVTNIIDSGIAQVIEANRINVEQEISAIKQTQSGQASSIDRLGARFDNLTVGGRNLLLNTQALNPLWTRPTSIENGVATFVATGRLLASTQQSDNVQALENGKVTISFTAKSNRDGRLHIRLRRFNTNNQLSDIAQYIAIDSREFKRYSLTLDYSKWTNQERVNFEIATYERAGFVCEVKLPKLEIGTIPTDWTPAPEDTQSLIDALVARITALENS